MKRWCIPAVILGAFLLWAGASASAATFRLRSDFTATRSPITLRDLVAIEDCDPETCDALGSLPLFPAPPIGESRFVNRDEIRDLLILRGIDMRMHTWTGAFQIRIVTSPTAPTPPEREKNSSQLQTRAQERLTAALEDYWRRTFPESPKCRFEFVLSPEDVKWFSAADASLVVNRVQALSADTWLVDVLTQVGQEKNVTQIKVKCGPPSQVVVAARPLSRDVIIGRSDVALSERAGPVDSEIATQIEEVVGKQLTLAISAGKPIPRSALRDPVVIRRGDLIQVTVRASGVTVRTAARAKDDGVVGHLIPIETLDGKGKTIMARVVGPKQVEIYAMSPEAEASKNLLSRGGL